MAAINILETTGLTKVYGGISANRNVDFQLVSGKITALIGPNGAGKSTFVGIVSGRIEATMGRVMFDGKDVSHLPAHKRIQLGIAYTFQITSVFSVRILYFIKSIYSEVFSGSPSIISLRL